MTLPLSDTALNVLNQADEAQAVALLLPFIERAPQVAKLVAKHRPFATPAEIATTVQDKIENLPEAELLSLFCAHPELAPPAPETMTPASQEEQGRLGLDAPDAALTERFSQLNAAYQDRFGFPFILALHRMTNVTAVLQTFEQRLGQTHAQEIKQNCAEIASVSAARIHKAFGREVQI